MEEVTERKKKMVEMYRKEIIRLKETDTSLRLVGFEIGMSGSGRIIV
jgi:hypothetical protein